MQFSYEPRSVNDKSQLSEGWHPAYLLAITDEETPPQWEMFKASPRLWRWWFAVWEAPPRLAQDVPELQSGPTSQKFSPGGRYQPSKAYVWTCELLGKPVAAGEAVDLDPLMPLPCRLKIKRSNQQGQPIEYANIVDLERWADGQPLLTAELRQKLTTFWAMKQAQPASPAPPVAAPVTQAAATWTSPPGATEQGPPVPSKPAW